MNESYDHLGEGNQLAEYQPEVDHLWIGGEGQLLHHADEDGRHHQHCCQVHTQGRLEEERLEEGGGKGDCSQKKGREVGGHHLACDLPLHHDNHSYPFLSIFKGGFAQIPVNVLKEDHVQSLAHNHLVRN